MAYCKGRVIINKKICDGGCQNRELSYQFTVQYVSFLFNFLDNTCDQDKAKKPRTRPKSCFVVFKGNAIIDEEFSREKSKKLKRSISLFDKIKRSVGEGKYSFELDQEEEDAISELFLKLKQIPTANMEKSEIILFLFLLQCFVYIIYLFIFYLFTFNSTPIY